MVSMICCKVGSLVPSHPSGPCLVFLITSENSNTTVDGIRFYRAPWWVPNVLTSWLSRRMIWVESSASNLSPLDFCSPSSRRTRMWLCWDRGGSTCWSHSDDQVSESIQNNNQFQSLVLRNNIPLLGVSNPFYRYPFNGFLQSQQSNISTRRI